MSLERAKDLVDVFNNGDFYEDIEPYFNDLITFFKFVKKYGLLDELNLNQISNRDWDDELIEFLDENGALSNLSYHNAPPELANILLLRGLEDNYEDTIVFITSDLLTDVEIRPDGFYLYLKDREELANFYCGGGGRRREGVRHIAEQVFSENGLDYGYYDSSSKPYETVTELDVTNLTKLKDIIYKEIGNTELSLEDYDSDFFESLSEEQGTPGYFRIRPEDLNDLLKDTDATNELFSNDLEEIGQELRSLYYNAENSAYEQEIYDAIYGGLDELFEGKIDEVPIQSNGKTRYIQYIKIRDFVKEIKGFLENNKGATYSDSFLEYYGTYSEFLVGLINDDIIECIDVRIPDYPDYSMTQKNINDYFNDYI